jgi:hypothetical protein
MRRVGVGLTLGLALSVVGCGSGGSGTDGIAGVGGASGTNSATGGGGTVIVMLPEGGSGGSNSSDAGCGSNLTGLLRDFRASPPEFEGPIADDRGLVKKVLGLDGKPVYAGPTGGTATTSGKAKFDQWYNDVPNVNMRKPFTIPFQTGTNGIVTYNNQSFFPIDGELLGNENNAHNFHFTFELHTTFVYKAGDTFRFRGDDDLWLFINKQLFYNERHTTQSEIEIQMTLVFKDCGVVPR